MIRNRRLYKDQKKTFTWDYAYELSKAGSALTISTSTWEADSNLVTVSGAAIVGKTTKATITAAQTGGTVVKNKVTFSDGQITERYLRFAVNDPMSTSNTDYP